MGRIISVTLMDASDLLSFSSGQQASPVIITFQQNLMASHKPHLASLVS